VSKTINGQTIGYVYNGAQAIGEVSGGAISATILTTLAIDDVVARYTQAGARTYLSDALGSVFALAKDDQSIQAFYAYSPYGEAQGLGDDEGNPIQHTGRENDQTGLHFYRTRYYDPVLKRFISEDQIGLLAGTNFYAYVGNNPVSAVDPLGLWSLSVSGYYGWGGGVSVTGEGFHIGSITFEGGVGLGGGVNFNPWGGKPDPNASSNSNSIGVAAGGNVGWGPFSLGMGWNYGGTQDCKIRWHEYGGLDPEYNVGKSTGGIPIRVGGFSLEGEIRFAVQITHNF